MPLTFYWVVLAWVPFRANDVYIDRMEASDRGAKRLIRTSAGFQDATDHALIYPFATASFAEGEAESSVPLLVRDRKSDVWRGKSPNGSEIAIRLHQSGFSLTGKVWQSLVLLEDHSTRRVCNSAIALVLGVLALAHGLSARGTLGDGWRRIPDWLFYGLLGAGWGIAVVLKSVAYTPFIYFQF